MSVASRVHSLATMRATVRMLVSVIVLFVWVGFGMFVSGVIADALRGHPYFCIAIVVVIDLIVAVGGLVAFWNVAAEVWFWKRGYRLLQVSPREYWRWSLGPKKCIYQERTGRGNIQSLEYVRVILADGYPAPCELRFPSAQAWDAQVPLWARGRRTEILQRISNCIQFPEHMRIVDIE